MLRFLFAPQRHYRILTRFFMAYKSVMKEPETGLQQHHLHFIQ
jgi:hypothetical protein